MSPNVIVKFVILFFIRAQSLNVKFSRLDAVVSRAYAKYGALFKLSVPLLAAASVFALFNLYDFAKANYALTIFLLALGSPLLAYSFFKAIKSAMIANTAAKGITNSAKVIADFIALKKLYVSSGGICDHRGYGRTEA